MGPLDPRKRKQRPQASMMTVEEQLNWPEEGIEESDIPESEGGGLPAAPGAAMSGAKNIAKNADNWLEYLFKKPSKDSQGIIAKMKDRMPQNPMKTGKGVDVEAGPSLDYSKMGSRKPSYTDTSGDGGRNIGNEIIRKRNKKLDINEME